MATYDSYKDSGVKWLGQIPSHWDTGKMREFFSERKQLSQDGSETLLSVSEYSGITPSVNDSGENVSRSASLIGYKKCKSSDLIINIMLAWKRGLGISDYDGIVSPAYCVFVTHNINPHYANYLLRTDLYTAEFKRNSTGIIESRLRMYPDDFKNIICIHPPKREQEAIVAYLDKVTAEIDRAIEAQKKMIDALNERKQIIITRAVTHGLNPDTPLRDSGIDWLGQIPAQWDVSQLKRFASLILGKMLDTNGGPTINWSQYICAKDVHFDGVDTSNLKSMYFSEKERTMYRVVNGDVLIVEGGAGAGGCAIAKNIPDKIFIQNSIIIIRPKIGLNNEYIAYLIQSFVKRGYIEFACNKATIPHFTKEKVGRMPISVPPIDEQKQIVSHINSIIRPIEDSISHCERMISLLNERKQIIINEVVTGKKKVI